MSDLSERARQSVVGDEVISLARRLVAVRSENPPGSTREACEVVAAELEPAGFELEYLEPADGFVSLVATHVFPEPGRTLLLNGHVDVVPVGHSADDWTCDPWAGEVRDGSLFGRGSLDMKGPLAGLVVAARSLVRSELPLRGTLVLTAVADEEQGGHRGSGALVAAGKAQADAVVIAEPGDGGVVVAHRGMCFLQLTTHGRSAHASMPERGVNAVELMLDALTACRSVELRHTAHPILGGPSVAIGTTIAGGQRVNVVPDRCQATLDVRSVPGMTEAGVLEDFREHFRRLLPASRQPELETLVWGEPAETSPDAEVVGTATAAFQREFGHMPPVRGMPAATDGWWFANRAGIPTVMGLAPGGIEGCHVVDEHVDVEELVRYARVYADLTATFMTS